MQRLFVTGIDTDIGKTIVSAVLTEALEADYWKPVQAGGLNHTDSDQVRALISNTKSTIFSEAYRLKTPASPHLAAQLDNVSIELDQITCPEHSGPLVIEGAGGLLVPLNDQHTILDLVELLQPAVVLVSRNYLGSINHTLLSLEVLKSRGIKVAGIIISGDANPETERIISQLSEVQVLGHVEWMEDLGKEAVFKQAQKWRKLLP